MRYALIALSLFTALTVHAQTTPEKVSKAASGLFPQGHKVLLANEEQWTMLSKRFTLDTDNAFTNMDAHITVLRSKFVESATPQQLRHVLGHEAGHVHCNCYDEGTAEFFAHMHL
jgi:hypothetical protein